MKIWEIIDTVKLSDEKNIKNIMAVENIEKEPVREYNRDIDKQKANNRFEENKINKKNKNRRNNGNSRDFDEGKLKSLRQTNKLSNMFDDQDGGMLDYYDLTPTPPIFKHYNL